MVGKGDAIGALDEQALPEPARPRSIRNGPDHDPHLPDGAERESGSPPHFVDFVARQCEAVPSGGLTKRFARYACW